MVASSACWGFATVLSKSVIGAIPPLSLLSVQLFSSVLFLWALVLVFDRGSQLTPSVLKASLCGILEPGLSYATGLFGLALTGASQHSIISSTEPLIIVFVAWLILKQRPSRRSLVAILIAVAGLFLVSTKGSSSGAVGSLLGNLLVILGTVFASLYVVITSRFVINVTPAFLSALQQSVGLLFSVVLLSFALLFGFEKIQIRIIPTNAWLLVVLSGIVQYALAFWFYLYGLKTLPVSQAALYLALIPVFASAGAALFLREPIGPYEIIGGTLVVSAIVVGGRQKKEA